MPRGNCCAFRSCHSRSGHGISMFSFPKDPEQAKLWLKTCYRSDLLSQAMTLHKSSYRLCEVHFEEKYISKRGSEKRLFSNALPSIFSTKGNNKNENISEPKEEASKGNKHEASEGSKTVHHLSGPSPSKEVICEPLESIKRIEETNIPPPLFSTSAATQTPLQLSSNSPRKRKMKNQLRSLKKK